MKKKIFMAILIALALAATVPANVKADENKECYSLNVKEVITTNPMKKKVAWKLEMLYLDYYDEQTRGEEVAYNKKAAEEFIARETAFVKKWLPYFDSLVEKHGVEKSIELTLWKASQELEKEIEQNKKATAKDKKEEKSK